MRYLYTMIAALGLLLLGTMPASADDHEASLVEAGPVDLSGGLNAGEHVDLGSVDLAEGEWTITASVRLFVGDPDDGKPATEQKNSQGCGLYADGEQVGGAGGSSSLWTSADGGKDVVFTEWWDGAEFQPQIVLDGPTVLSLTCFIDASHSGVTEGDRTGMAATDIAIHAVRTVEPEPCEFDETLTAEDEACVEPVDEIDEDTKDEPVDETEDETTSASTTEDPKPVPTAIPAGAELPKTGISPLLGTGIGIALLLAGAGLLLARRRTQ